MVPFYFIFLQSDARRSMLMVCTRVCVRARVQCLSKAGLSLASANGISIRHQADGNTASHTSSLNVSAADAGSAATDAAEGTEGSSSIRSSNGASKVTLSAETVECINPPTSTSSNNINPAGRDLEAMLYADAALLETRSTVASITGSLSATALQTSRITSEPDQTMQLIAQGAGLNARAFLDATVHAHLEGVRITAAAAGAKARFSSNGGNGDMEFRNDVQVSLDSIKMAATAGETGGGGSEEGRLSLAACVCSGDGSLFAVPGDVGSCDEWAANNPEELAQLCA